MTSDIIKLIAVCWCSAFFIPCFGQTGDNAGLDAIREHRQKQDSEMRSASSPLLPKDRKKFKGLKYFPPDLSYRVTAKLIRTEHTPLFAMKTTTARLPQYRKYGEVHFQLDGTDHVLEVYQNPDLMKREGYEDYLFIPFTDDTNGKETYEVGRYLEMRIPEGDEVILDFNLSYNPYCSYNAGYSCPIPPAANQLPREIRAGEKKFRNH
jgi:uncharacterized protein